jgi:hypothetical protein
VSRCICRISRCAARCSNAVINARPTPRRRTALVVGPESLRVAHIIHGAWGVEAPNGFLTVVFATHEWAGEPVNAEPAKHAQVRWVDTDALPDEFVPTTGSVLTHYLSDDVQVSLRGWA